MRVLQKNIIILHLLVDSTREPTFLEKMNYFSFFKQKICFVKNKCLYL